LMRKPIILIGLFIVWGHHAKFLALSLGKSREIIRPEPLEGRILDGWLM